MRYFKDDTGEFVTMYNVVIRWKSLRDSGDLADYHGKFIDFFNACLAINNGTLTEISEADAQMVSVETFYYTPGKYGDVQHRGKTYYDRLFRLKDTIDNAKEINWDGVNFVMIDEDDNRISQAAGYTNDRGLFCDLY